MPTETTLNSLKVHKVPDFDTWEDNYNQTNGIGVNDVVIIPPEELKKGVLPDQQNNSGKFLTTNGSATSWATVSIPSAADATPAMDGTAAVGTSTDYAREDHVHPTDTSRAASSHSHGNITNGGDITATAPTIANGDQIVINDNSESKITNGPTFDGSTTNKYLSPKGTWESIPTISYPVTSVNTKTGAVTLDNTDVGAAASSHTHGNIQNNGILQTTDIAVANGDKLVVTDSSDSNKIARTSISFDGSTTSKYLSQKGSWESVPTVNYPVTSVNNKTGVVSLSASDVSAVATSAVGANSGVAPLNASGKIDSTYLPSYVDDVIEGYYYNSKFYTTSAHTTEITGESGKIYIDLATNKSYRYGSSAYVEISSSIAITGGASTIVTNDLTANRALISNASGKVAVSDVTSTELGYLDGVTSAVQTQIDGKQTKITASGLLKGNGSGGVSAAVAGTDYQTPLVSGTDYAPASHTHGNITSGGDITATAPTIANGDQIIINDNSASKITNGPTFDGSTTTKYLSQKGTWESLPTDNDHRDSGYGQIKAGTANSSTSAITANTTTAQASTYNELLTINPGNKWISVAASNSSTSGSDTFTIGHSAGLTAKTSYGSTATTASADGGTITVTDVKYDQAGHITGSTDRTITLSQSDEIFIAEYNVTTFAEIKTAYDAGKTIFLYWNWDGSGAYNEYVPLTEFFDATKSTDSGSDQFTFILSYPDIIYTFSCYNTTPTTWGDNSISISHIPTNHSTSATTYGKGTDANYGHVKLSDSTSSTSSTSDGIAATPTAVKAAYDLTVARTKIYTASCSTAAATAAKVATLDDSTGFSLTAGVMVAVRFTNGNSATTPTLNVNSTGAKNITIPNKVNEYVSGSGTTYNTWAIYETVLFTYTGSSWVHAPSGLLGYLAYNTASGRQAKITASGILKGDGSGGVTAATAGTDYAAASHTHGNITSGGDITATAPTIANGDQLIINDDSAGKITNGPTFDGSTTTSYLSKKGTWETPSIPKQSTWYGTCSTTDSTAQKDVTCSGYELTTGNIIGVYFSTANTAATPTLNINSTGAKSIYVGNSAPNGTINVLKWSTYTMVYFIYDGTGYRYITSVSPGSVAPSRGANTWYGTSDTAGGANGKVAIVDNFVLTKGAIICITFTYGNSQNPNALLLDVNGTGSKYVYYNNAATSSTNSLIWDSNETLIFIYDGTFYHFAGKSTSLPRQSGNSGKYLTTDGTNLSWAAVDALPSQSGNSGKYLTTNGSAASWATVDALPSQTGNSGKYLTTNGTTASWGDSVSGSLIDTEDLSEIIDSTPTANSDNLVTSGGVYTAINNKANIASPTFTGTPAAPTATAGTNTTQIATTAFVNTALTNKITYGTTDLTAGTSTLATGVIYLVYE